MIIRPATLVVAGTTMPRSATPWRPKRRPRGPAERGSGSVGYRDRVCDTLGRPHPATGSHLPLEDTARPFAVATRSAGRGTREAGSTHVGDAATALMDDWAVHPAAGWHLPSEDTAPPFAVAPFASSPFAHPIPQSRRRARAGFIQRFLKYSVLRYPITS